MVYRVIGLMSGSSLDGLDIACVEFEKVAGKWQFIVRAAESVPYPPEWVRHLSGAIHLPALDYQLLHSAYGHYIGEAVNHFIDRQQLHFSVQLIASHGHTSFHVPGKQMTAQLGDGAAIAALTGIHTVSDLRAMDVALGGQGAPVVPIGEQLLWPDYAYYVNLGGIANLTWYQNGQAHAFDICPANRVMNMLAATEGHAMDEGGALARSGRLQQAVLDALNAFPYYSLPAPKSLANDFGTDEVYPLLQRARMPLADALRTYVEHIAFQLSIAVKRQHDGSSSRMLLTGGGAHNTFLLERIRSYMQPIGVEVMVPEPQTVDFKEAIVMALLGLLRWREECNVFASVTGASRDSVGGAFWLGR